MTPEQRAFFIAGIKESKRILKEMINDSSDIRCCGAGRNGIESSHECCGDTDVLICGNDLEIALSELEEPSGFIVVPKEPTKEMLDSVAAADQHEPFSNKTLSGIYKEMINTWDNC